MTQTQARLEFIVCVCVFDHLSSRINVVYVVVCCYPFLFFVGSVVFVNAINRDMMRRRNIRTLREERFPMKDDH